jgi:hypothetical protein
MFLYVTVHGLSYEKFYASYAVLFCFILFGLLIYVLVSKAQRTLLQDACALLIWMYAIVCLLPVEQCIIRFNVARAQVEGNQIDMADMRMLSLDVYSYVRENSVPLQQPGGWNTADTWTQARERQLRKKKWYEHTVSSALSLMNAR